MRLPPEEAKFRQGVTHGAQWFRDEVKRLSKQGATAEEISDRLGNLNQVLMDWRIDLVEMPDGNPWEWSRDKLDDFISKRKNEW